MVLSLKSWLTYVGVVDFDLYDDGDDINWIWGQDYYPLPEYIVYDSADAKKPIAYDYNNYP